MANLPAILADPPLITISPTRFIDLAEGESLDLRCDVFGIPVPSVVWVNGTGPGKLIIVNFLNI